MWAISMDRSWPFVFTTNGPKTRYAMTYGRKSGYRLVFSLIVLIPTAGLHAQPDPTVLLRQADQYFEVENFEASVTECLRFIHLADDHPFVYYAYYRAGFAEARLGNWAGSIRWLRAAARTSGRRQRGGIAIS